MSSSLKSLWKQSTQILARTTDGGASAIFGSSIAALSSATWLTHEYYSGLSISNGVVGPSFSLALSAGTALIAHWGFAANLINRSRIIDNAESTIEELFYEHPRIALTSIKTFVAIAVGLASLNATTQTLIAPIYFELEQPSTLAPYKDEKLKNLLIAPLRPLKKCLLSALVEIQR